MSKSSMLCLDASIIVGLATGDISGELREEARGWFLNGTRFIAPNLMGYEFANAMYKSVKRGADPGVVATAFEAMRNLRIDLVDCSDFHEEAIAIARKYVLRASYDAHYVALAARREVELVTSDRELAKALEQDYPFVRYIPQPHAR